ncbi:tRNA epoxyqueuosine(34) reductase QueG [Alicyclobacillus sp. SO9]|uniref:tRNA epoxyqueuosine(34) reductase QueG n=1 Tax=Alicyclobacillus sp. SO9 TaxID=2665646 RepID=UPI0018E77FB6|nr:tRNA epoxyqueuosine(34) reductase QueG [Alicyclobacillus sp. SO9]QQE79602.1 tRNA epoxyqueuosine(34) reductase QueG [Alicyclobacillus sp. SO9]
MTFAVSLEDLKQLGRKAGFDDIGATSADDFPELIPRLQAYENRGRTGFETGDIALRSSPRQWMPEAKSLIAVSMAYLTEAGKNHARRHPVDSLRGRVTVYSYGQDYHQVMKERMADLHELLSNHVGHTITANYAIDTSPLVDRRIAERAGIGWMGKNALLYSSQYGSYVFLGALLVDIEVELSQNEMPSRCGSCTRCMIACPTNAIVGPGVIDAKRCLSFVTQMKGIIPREFRKPMGKRIWGCDTCQTVCPENEGIESAPHEEYLPQGELEYPQLLEVLTWSNREFAWRYGRTAAAWRGVRTWQRNALIALGNCKNRDAVSHIVPFLSHSRAELRASAAWALQQLETKAGQEAVAQAYFKEDEDVVREEMKWAVDATS